jgi:hypothetical protein
MLEMREAEGRIQIPAWRTAEFLSGGNMQKNPNRLLPKWIICLAIPLYFLSIIVLFRLDLAANFAIWHNPKTAVEDGFRWARATGLFTGPTGRGPVDLVEVSVRVFLALASCAACIWLVKRTFKRQDAAEDARR